MHKQNDYEKQLNFNKFLSWVHSLRYKKITQIFEHFKSEIKDRPIRVLEIGSAHAQLFEVLNQRFNIEYGAIEAYPAFVTEARTRFGHHANFSIQHACAVDPASYQHFANPDIIVSLETLEHIPAKEVEIIIEQVAKMRPKLFVCSVPVEIGPAVWLKNLTSLLLGYTRHKHYTWAETFWAGIYRLDKLPPHTVEHKGFDWRKLTATIEKNMKINKIQTLPFNLLPTPLANSIFIVARTRSMCPGLSTAKTPVAIQRTSQ